MHQHSIRAHQDHIANLKRETTELNLRNEQHTKHIAEVRSSSSLPLVPLSDPLFNLNSSTPFSASASFKQRRSSPLARSLRSKSRGRRGSSRRQRRRS